MLHRMKLRVVYGDVLASDRPARKRKLRVLLLAGVGIYFPFLYITYHIFLETRALYLTVMGLLASLVCIPVVLYAYASGFGRSYAELRRERGAELGWLVAKIGFFYAFELFWMILGIVEFLLGYHAFRAALISFVAIAVARDGFEIGYYRARQPEGSISIFPDNRSIIDFLKAEPMAAVRPGITAGAIGALLGAGWAPWVPKPLYQTLLIGALAGLLSTLVYFRSLGTFPAVGYLIRFFIWPAFTMACTYFLIFAYLLRIIFAVQLSPFIDQALLTGGVSLLMAVYGAFLGYLKKDATARRPDPSILGRNASRPPTFVHQ
jgi:hypothetical protein